MILPSVPPCLCLCFCCLFVSHVTPVQTRKASMSKSGADTQSVGIPNSHCEHSAASTLGCARDPVGAKKTVDKKDFKNAWPRRAASLLFTFGLLPLCNVELWKEKTNLFLCCIDRVCK